MAAYNEITGDRIATKGQSDSYRDGWDRIFGKKDAETPQEEIHRKTVKLSKLVSPELMATLEKEIGDVFNVEVARELVHGDIPVIDEELFQKVIESINGKNGTKNPFDAPILYKIFEIKRNEDELRAKEDARREEWYEYCLIKDSKSEPFPTFQEWCTKFGK